MAIDSTALAQLVAEFMDDLEKDQAELGDEQTVGEVMLVAEVRGEDDSGGYTYMRYRCTDTREWVQRGMLHAALEQAAEKDLDDEDEDED